MASHLTVTTTSSAGTSVTKGLAAQAGANSESEGGLMTAFAALLSGASQALGRGSTQSAAINQSAQSSTDLKLAGLVDLSLAFGNEDDQSGADPEALAAVADATLPIQNAAEPNPVIAELSEVLDGLTELKANLDAGEPLDPEVLKGLETKLESLAGKLGIDLDQLPDLSNLTKLVSDLLPEDASFEAQLTRALSPMVQALQAETAPDTPAGAELSSIVKSLTDKLGALLQSVNSGQIDLADLGLDADKPLDPDLEAAIAKLVATTAKVETTANTQALATPALKLTEAVLTGKTTVDLQPAAQTSAVQPVTAEAVAQVAAETDAGAGQQDRPDTDKPADLKVETRAEAKASAVAGPTENSQSPEPTNLTPQQASRVDAAAAPRVIQAGYQTSQQQLNLPQLAFEVVRQVSDGNTRFQIRLDPAELGRIDVKLDIDADGKVNARLTVEKPETLDMMQRDQRGLERALQQAGLDSAKTNLEFSLKQNPFGGGQQGQDGNGRPPMFNGETSAEADEVPPPTVNLYRGRLTASGVNIIA